MAFQKVSSVNVCNNFFRHIAIVQYYFKGILYSTKTPSVDCDDSLDHFTRELIQKKIESWEVRNNKFKSVKSSYSDKLRVSHLDQVRLNKTKLTEVLNCALQECNDVGVIKLIKKCVEDEICPNNDVLLQALEICAQKGEINLIKDVKKICIKQNVIFYPNFDLSIYVGFAIWKKGNIIKALEEFEILYTNNPFLRRHIRVSLKQLILNREQQFSEAVLVNLIKFSDTLVIKYKDYFPMLYLWEICFMSEWFSDQQIALDLLCKNKKLAELIIHRLPYILYVALRNNKTEAIYRLLEIMLDLRMEEQYGPVVVILLDYHFFHRNLRSYSETIKWCETNNVKLPSIYKEKYLQLMLNKHEVLGDMPKKVPKKNDYKFVF